MRISQHHIAAFLLAPLGQYAILRGHRRQRINHGTQHPTSGSLKHGFIEKSRRWRHGNQNKLKELPLITPRPAQTLNLRRGSMPWDG
jgi:hypothetical protein